MLKVVGSFNEFKYPYIVAVDTNSNSVYVTGYSAGTLDNQISAGAHDIILFKYDELGSQVWIQQLGTSGEDQGYGGKISMV